MERLPGFHVLAKPTGPICNLDCRYCFYLEKEKLYTGVADKTSWRMPHDVLDCFIMQYIGAQEAPVIDFAWQGGEPTLLGLDFFQEVVALQKKHAKGKRIKNAFQTNGVLLDDPWCEFLANNGFLIGLSIDGPRRLHDTYRVDKGGRPTFDAVMRGIGYLKKHNVEFNTLTVVNRRNSYYALEVYRFLKQVGSGFMQFVPVVERAAVGPMPHGLSLVSPEYRDNAKVTEWSVEPRQYGSFLCTIFDEWVHHDVGRCYVQLFDVALEAWVGTEPSLCIFRKTCGNAMAIEHNGDLYSCDHYVYPENKLGNVSESSLLSLAGSLRQRKFGLDKWDALPKYCRTCEVRFACNGECPKHRFLPTADGEGGLNYLCAGYKLFFKHINPYMTFMAAELREKRSPANIMQWLQRREPESPGEKKGRNDACPCGSGRKYKRCCGQDL